MSSPRSRVVPASMRSTRSRVGGTTGSPSVTPLSNQISNSSVVMTAAMMLYLGRFFRHFLEREGAIMRRFTVAILTVALALALVQAPADAQYKPEFKNSLVVGPVCPWGEGAAKFADLLRERTQGR